MFYVSFVFLLLWKRSPAGRNLSEPPTSPKKSLLMTIASKGVMSSKRGKTKADRGTHLISVDFPLVI